MSLSKRRAHNNPLPPRPFLPPLDEKVYYLLQTACLAAELYLSPQDEDFYLAEQWLKAVKSTSNIHVNESLKIIRDYITNLRAKHKGTNMAKRRKEHPTFADELDEYADKLIEHAHTQLPGQRVSRCVSGLREDHDGKDAPGWCLKESRRMRRYSKKMRKNFEHKKQEREKPRYRDRSQKIDHE